MTVTSIPVNTAPSPLRVPPAQVHFPAEDRQTILRMIDETLASGQLTLGRLGQDLEERFAARHRSDFAVAVSSGTSAIEISLRCLGVAGKEILVPANTFAATAAAVIAAGARPRFVDCDPETMAPSPESVQAAIGPHTAGLVVVHIGGSVTREIKELQIVCAHNGVFLFEDAAHAHGSNLDGRCAGTFGIAGSFSFYPTKVMAGGEGGMILTDDEQIAEDARIYRDQGKAGFLANVHTHLGYNWRLSEPHAAIALSQLGRLDQFIAHRQRIAARYDEALAELPLTPLRIPVTGSPNYYKYVAFLPEGVNRVDLKKLLREEYGVALSGEVYELPLHRQPAFERWATEPLPGAEWICSHHICLPVSAVLSDEQADLTVDALADALGRF